MAAAQRTSRIHTEAPKDDCTYEDQRDAFQHDFDRLIHSLAFRRLAGVTQVVNPTEGHVFHNRLTHTLKVTQIARRLAERLARKKSLSKRLGGLDVSVVEAAALAHDLGHPPFGHVAERALNELIVPIAYEGYEGNAQSFRIATKLGFQRCIDGSKEVQPGLNLTYATLNAILKYPRLQIPKDKDGNQHRKWGVYLTEREVFEEIRRLQPGEGERRSLEAEIMDWADDVAYAIHDLEDFFRAGLIPLHQLDPDRGFAEPRQFIEFFMNNVFEADGLLEKGYSKDDVLREFNYLTVFFPREPYRGTPGEKADLATNTSRLIGRFACAIELNNKAVVDKAQRRVEINSRERLQVRLLQSLTRYYVIENPALASQQSGQMRVIRELFQYYYDASDVANIDAQFPIDFRSWLKEELSSHQGTLSYEHIRARVVADKISSLSDDEALRMFHRINGQSLGSVLDRM